MKLGLLIAALGIGAVAFADPTITDVTARQRYPWNGKVDISYTASGIEAAAKQKGWITSLKVTAKDNDTETTYTATTLTGDTSFADGTHALVWDMIAQGLTFKSTNVTFDVTCVTKDAVYCVIDLSGGSTATSYPVTYLSEIPGGSWSDEYKTTKLVLRRIEPGTCVVTVDKPYYIGVFEMTQKQYELVTGSTPSYFSGNDKRPVEQVSYNSIRGSNLGAQYPSSTDVDTDSFAGKCRTRTGLLFDLPTAAQWEYACRAGTTTKYSYGNDPDYAYMWCQGNSGSYTHDVGTRKENLWGLYDMHGNVWEWCLDFGDYWCNERLIRGASCTILAEYCTSSCGNHDYPSGIGLSYTGFRLVMNLTK